MKDIAEALKEEFASVTIVVDHLVLAHEGPHTVVKTVWSTETATEALAAQINYFKQSDLLASSKVLHQMAAGLQKAVAYVYAVNERQTQIIVDAALWGEVLENDDLGGTVMSAISSFITLGTDIMTKAREAGLACEVLTFVPND